MTDVDRARARRRIGVAAGLLAAGALAGGVLAGTLSASAASSTPSSTTSSSSSGASSGSSSTAAPGPGPGNAPGRPGGADPVRSDETKVTGSNADTLRAAALKAVPGGTVYRIETDAGDAAYEVHMTKADGTLVTVKFDKNLAVVKVESGMGEGDPAPQGGTPQPPNGAQPPNGSGPGSGSATPAPSGQA